MWKKENLRKNFLRVKQIADQNFGRAEKSEVLTEDQQGNEKRVEVVRHVSHNLIKKVTALLEAPPGTDHEKRLKKLPETNLSHTLMESANSLGTDTLLGSICQQCGDCQGMLAREELQCELEIEREVLTPLQIIAEVDIPSILKIRKQLNKSTLDMDSAKNRFNSAVRQSHVPGANMASAAAKADAVKEEYEEACNKVEAIKDNLSIELCNFVSKENEHSSRLVALLESQAAYHQKALQIIQSVIPKMKSTIEAYEAKPVFGMPLEEHLQLMGRDISLVMEALILTLLDTGMEEEGLFRIAGSALKLKKLKACFDAHAVDMEEFGTDPHTVAGILKQYLRELPEPLLTFDLHSEFMQALQLPQEQRFKALYTTLNKLPPANYNNVRYLIKFLALLAEKSAINKMTPSNIAIVMGPNLLWAKGETAPNMLTAGAVSTIVEAFIIHADQFFPGDIDFNVSGGYLPDSPGQERHNNSIMTMSSPCVMTHPSTGSAAPPAAVTSSSPTEKTNAVSPSSDSPEGPSLSPKMHRRASKKPAPPPPPDRSYNVAVTASVSKGPGNGAVFSQTLPRSLPSSLPDPASVSAHSEDKRPSPPERRISGHGERPNFPPPERPSMPPPERPRGPPPTSTPSQHPGGGSGGHQRSASTGAMHIVTESGASAGTSCHEPFPPGVGPSLTVGQGNIPSGTCTLGRHSSMRPARPNPPPPPPPVNMHTEETHL